MEAPEENLTGPQTRLIAALLTESTIGKAAAVAGISESTAMRYMAQDAFQHAFTEAKRAAVGHALARLQGATGRAVEALVEVLNSKKSPPSTKVSAAKAILESALRAQELEDLGARLEALERRLAERQPAVPTNGRRSWT